MSDESQAAMRRAAEQGPEFLAQQRAHVEEVARKEAERRANLPVEPLPEGYFETKEEASAWLDEQRAKGRTPQPIDDGTGNGDFAIKVSSPFNGYDEVWITSVAD